MCAVAGVLVLSLPITIIAANFERFHKNHQVRIIEKRQQKRRDDHIFAVFTTKCSFYKSLQNFTLGKLSEKSNKSILEFIKSEQRLTDVFCDQDIEVKNCSLIGDSIAQVSYQRRADAVKVSKRTLLVQGAQVTAYARIFLDRALRKLNENSQPVAYSDTDSAIFIKKRSDKHVLDLHESC